MNFPEFEDAVYSAIEDMGLTRSDAQGVAMLYDLDAAYYAGRDPVCVADAIMMQATP